ncbi:MAG: MFS transporter [Candidatus Paceibacterota bacterium]
METFARILQRNTIRRGKKNSGFVQLFISKRLIQGAAAALVAIFVPIFLYQTAREQFYIVGLYYALLSFLYVVLLVPGMHLTNLIGFSRALIIGGVFSVLQYAVMYFMNADNLYTLLIPFTIAVVGFRIFHWVPYHVDFTLFTDKGERARVVSLSFATIAFMGVIGPILAGFIIKHAGYEALFLVTVVLLAAATVSYTLVPSTDVHFDWTYLHTLKELFSQDRRGVVMGEFANGAEVAITLIVWPIFLFEVLAGDVFSIGAVSTVVVALTIVIQLLVGRYLDKRKGNNEKTLRVGSTLYAVGWIFKIFVLSTAQIFFVGLYHNIVKIFTKTPFSAILYDMSAEQGKYVDEFTVLREMSGHSGRAVGLVVVSGLSLVVPIGWTFILAAVASLALNMVYRYQRS